MILHGTTDIDRSILFWNISHLHKAITSIIAQSRAQFYLLHSGWKTKIFISISGKSIDWFERCFCAIQIRKKHQNKQLLFFWFFFLHNQNKLGQKLGKTPKSILSRETKNFIRMVWRWFICTFPASLIVVRIRLSSVFLMYLV